jgi:hypothetical protein
VFLFPLTIITIQYNTKKPEKYVLLDNADNVMDNLSVVALSRSPGCPLSFFAYFGGKKPSAEGKWACWFANLFLGYELSIVVILISVYAMTVR